MPLRDPVRNIVSNARAEDIWHVMIDGGMVMQERELAASDVDQVTGDLQNAAVTTWFRLREGDWASRTVDGLSPNTCAPFEG